MEKILCPTIHVHRQHDCSYVDVGTVCYTVSRSMFVYTYFLRASLDNVCSLDLPYCTVYNTTESPSEYWRIMSGRKQFNMPSWLKPPNPTITQGLIQCQWCDLKLRRSAQGYAIVRKVHVENRDPLRKKLKFGKVKLRTPDACTTGTNPKRYYVLQYTCIDSMIVLMLTLVLYVIRYHVWCLFILTFYARPSTMFALSIKGYLLDRSAKILFITT